MKMSNWLIIAGIVSLIGGVLAFFNPFIAGLTVELLIAWSFVISGVFALIGAFTFGAGAGRSWLLTVGALSLLVGLVLLRYPYAGLAGLTVFIGIAFILSGASRIMMALNLKGAQFNWVLWLGASLSSFIGLAMLFNTMGWAPVALGTLLACELVFNGVSKLSYGWSHRHR